MIKNSTSIYNLITYPISIAYQGFLEFEHQIGHIAEEGEAFAQKNIDPYIKATINFSVCRLPNYKEAITNILTQTTINFFAGRAKSSFGNNPTAGAIFRDTSKLPSIEAQVAENNTIGFTETKYELGSLYASRTKVACKAAILTAYSTYKLIHPSESPNIEKETFQLTARGANYICEIPSRYLHIADKRKQAFEKQNPDMPKKEFLDFLSKDYKISWAFEAVGEAIVKTTTSDQLGELARHSKYEAHVKDAISFIDNTIANAFFAPGTITFNFQDDVYSKAFKYGVASSSAAISSGSIPGAVTTLISGVTAFVATTIVDFSGQLLIEIINTYALGTPTRICQDSTGIAISNVYNSIMEKNTTPNIDTNLKTMDLHKNQPPIADIDHNFTQDEMSYQNQMPLAGENGEL